jgi:hypothetical protein
MLTIVTCLRSRAVSSNWGYHVWLLQRTLDSLLAQTHPDFRIIVVCHEIPEIPQLKDPKVHGLSVSFSPPARNNDEMCADKVLKLTAGIAAALEQGTDYVMFADGDDLVSNRVAGFVAERPGTNGWFSNTELFYRYGGNLVRRYDLPHTHAGPNVIVRANALRFADASDTSEFWRRAVSSNDDDRYIQALVANGPRVNTLAAIGHTKYRALLDSMGCSLEPLPFVASVVILNPDSTSNVPGGEGSAVDASPQKYPLWRKKISRAKQVLQSAHTLRWLTPAMRQEFSIPVGGAVPPEFRTGGLPC